MPTSYLLIWERPMNKAMNSIFDWVTSQQTYIQLSIVVFSFVVAQLAARLLKNRFDVLSKKPTSDTVRPLELFVYHSGKLIFPVLSLLLLKISSELLPSADQNNWLIIAAITIGLAFFYISFIREFIRHTITSKVMLGLPRVC